jgi:hypothetical protein
VRARNHQGNRLGSIQYSSVGLISISGIGSNLLSSNGGHVRLGRGESGEIRFRLLETAHHAAW